MKRFLGNAATTSALVLSSVAIAQVPQAAPVDLANVEAVGGSWTYRPIAGGSEADFIASSRIGLLVRCNRETHTVTIARPNGSTAARALLVTTTYGARDLPASLDAARNLAATVTATDPLLDQIAFTSGKWAIADPSDSALVVPSWAEPVRVIEDCRS